MNTTNNATIADVLSGNESIKFEVSVNTKSIVLIGVVILVAVVGGILITKLFK